MIRSRAVLFTLASILASLVPSNGYSADRYDQSVEQRKQLYQDKVKSFVNRINSDPEFRRLKTDPERKTYVQGQVRGSFLQDEGVCCSTALKLTSGFLSAKVDCYKPIGDKITSKSIKLPTLTVEQFIENDRFVERQIEGFTTGQWDAHSVRICRDRQSTSNADGTYNPVSFGRYGGIEDFSMNAFYCIEVDTPAGHRSYRPVVSKTFSQRQLFELGKLPKDVIGFVLSEPPATGEVLNGNSGRMRDCRLNCHSHSHGGLYFP